MGLGHRKLAIRVYVEGAIAGLPMVLLLGVPPLLPASLMRRESKWFALAGLDSYLAGSFLY
ncbi:MAG: hypothetical protein ABWK01_06715 [Infirmifilum sp.]